MNGPTHQKRNEYDTGITPPTVETIPTSKSFSVRIDSDTKEKDVEWRLLITDEANEISRVYRLEQTVGKPYPLPMPKPISVTDFHHAKFGYQAEEPLPHAD